MLSPGTSSSTTGPWNISDAGPRFDSTKLATVIIRAALTLAVLAALLLIAALPAQAQSETVLYNFTGGSDGANPQSSLTFDGAGNLYGTTYSGGLFAYGTVFELSPNGIGGWNETVLYSFTGGADGGSPSYANVIFDSVGNLYGTAYSGGANGYGVVFELSPVGASWTETVLYSFANTPDGANPVNGLIMDPAGNLYGKTLYGGQGDGIVFELSPSAGGWTEQVIYAAAAEATHAGLTMDAAGNIFGTTYSTVFELSPNGNGGWNPTVIHTFAGFPIDGIDAEGTPVLDQAGNLYGTTYAGGAFHDHYWPALGTVYKLSPEKKGKWREEILHSFLYSGDSPIAGIVFDAAGNIYGTTEYSHDLNSPGIVYELAAASKNRVLKRLWPCCYYGGGLEHPYGALTLDSAGHLYGTTNGGGSTGNGIVFGVNLSPTVTTITLSSSANPSTYGQAVTFTALVSSIAGAPPDGETVSFMRGKTVLGTGSLSGDSASFTTSMLELGTTSVRAMYSGDLNFLGSTSNTVKQVVNGGTHQGPYGVVSPTALNFGQVVVGQTSPPQRVSLTNIGDSELTVSDISISADFAITVNYCANGVKPETHCDVYVTFTPQAVETESGSLTFVDNASNSPQTVSLTGTGLN